MQKTATVATPDPRRIAGSPPPREAPRPEGLCEVYRLGRVDYAAASELQQRLAAERRHQLRPDTLLFVEHPAVITLGRNARIEHLLTGRDQLANEGIALEESNRGGDVTYHGPGQLVGYPILDLGRIRKDVVWYVRTLEEAIIRTLAGMGIEAGRKQGMTGVWVEGSKVAAIGVHISRWITTHGFALNLETDPESFRHIVPCGIADYPVNSLHRILGRTVSWEEVDTDLADHLGRLLGLRVQWADRSWPDEIAANEPESGQDEMKLTERSQPCQTRMS